MPVYADSFTDTIVRLLREGGIGIVRTDTLYGLVARAADEQAVERMYKAKQRTPTKSPIVLISSVDQLFDTYDKALLDDAKKLWPGKNSLILPSTQGPAWLTRGNDSIAYRLPDNSQLQGLIDKTGPLIAPSANPEGQSPAQTIQEAKDYFGDAVDFYVDGGDVTDDTPSKLYVLTNDGKKRLR